MSLTAVLTTIQPPTPAAVELARRVKLVGGSLVVIGDQASPSAYLDGADLWTLEHQQTLPYRLASALPVKSYSRKNLGYLLAMQARVGCIYETDDDNRPNRHWAPRQPMVRAAVARNDGWANSYAHFTSRRIWPRGLPLSQIDAKPKAGKPRKVWCPIQYGLADGEPDVDAVWRLATGAPSVRFDRAPSLALAAGAWCPFPTQSTWWWPEAYSLMYLPSHCTFRMTDIWRGFVAQWCLWQMGGMVAHHAPEVTQARNPHDLVKNFADEVPGYLRNEEIRDALNTITPARFPEDNLLLAYEALVCAAVFPPAELVLLKAWLADLEDIRGSR